MAIEGIIEQIKSDDGVPGARVRKQAQRAKDANPVRVSGKITKLPLEDPMTAEEILGLDGGLEAFEEA